MNLQETLLIIVISTFIGKVFTQFELEHCDFYQSLELNVTYSIASPNFSENYLRGTDCRWAAEAPPGHKIFLNCRQVNLPRTFACNGDRILVSNTGRVDLRDGRKYCGGVEFAETSRSTRIIIALKSGLRSRGGKFKCSLKTVANSCSCGQLNRGRIG
jgi:hypothetical protein